MTIKQTIIGSVALLLCATVFVACNIGSINLLPAGNNQQLDTQKVSDGRLAAARAINTAPGSDLLFDIRQMSAVPPGQLRSDPLGLFGGTPWPSLFGGHLVFAPDLPVPPVANQSEYDFLAASGETEYCLGLRVPDEPNYPNMFTQVEFSLRAANPYVDAHVALGDYDNTGEADYPSNDDTIALRSLVDVAGGDVAILVQGIDFVGGPAETHGYMNGLGPTGWVLFMRDNAFNSGRFYNLPGVLRGAPRAFEDTPNPADDGAFESAQVNGDNFDANCEQTPPDPTDPNYYEFTAPINNYAIRDRSGWAEEDTLSGGGAGPFDPIATPDAALGQGGFLLVVRWGAFNGAGVIIDPNVPGPLPATVVAGDILNPVPNSGYDESMLPRVQAGPWITDNSAAGVPGVHEIGFSVFFTHRN